MSTGASTARRVSLSQYNVNRRFSLAIRKDQIDPQTRLPKVLSGCFMLIKSAEILQTADLCYSQSAVNSRFRKVELDRAQGCWINNSFDLFHREISAEANPQRARCCFERVIFAV
jgi:hypothetical protein